MSRGVAALSMMLMLLGAGCQSPGIRVSKPPPPGASQQNDSHITQAWDVFGSAHINQFGIVCAGRVTLKQGAAIVNDSCFTGDTNIVLCTETSAANPVRCKPGRGVLTIEGTGSDEIDYARVK